MVKTVVVAVDESEGSARTVQWAADTLLAKGDKAVIVHVEPGIESEAGLSLYPEGMSTCTESRYKKVTILYCIVLNTIQYSTVQYISNSAVLINNQQVHNGAHVPALPRSRKRRAKSPRVENIPFLSVQGEKKEESPLVASKAFGNSCPGKGCTNTVSPCKVIMHPTLCLRAK